MTDAWAAHEPAIRLGGFLGVLLVMALWEVAAPRRRQEVPRLLRWSNNLAIVAIDTLLVRLAVPVLAVGMAVIARDHGWGLFNVVDVPEWVAVAVSVVLLDAAIYLQHVAFHAVPVLWRLHRVHHADLEFDASTGLRFHPVEIALSMGIKLGVVVAIGAPAIAVLVFEVLLNATSLFNHGNVRLWPRVDRWLRLIVVTPDMHRVHHSVYPEETNRNFGFSLPWWDRLFGTYHAQPRDGHERMTIGLDVFRTRRDLWIDRLLFQPFRRAPARGSVTASARPADPVLRRVAVRAVLPAAAAVVAIVVFSVLPAGTWALALVEWMHGAGAAGIVAFAAAYVLATVLFVPGSLLTLGAGFVWGPVVGIAIVSPVSVAAATAAFLLARSRARPWVARRVARDPRFAAIDAAVARRGFIIVLLLRLSPAVPFTLLNYALGLTRVRLRDYAVASFAGMLPGTFLYLYLGSLATTVASIGEAAAAPDPARRMLYWLGLGATAIVTVVLTRLARRALRVEVADPAIDAPTGRDAGAGT